MSQGKVVKTLLKLLPSSLRWLVRPALFGSVGLHLLLLLMPVPERPAAETATSDQVQVTRLPQPSSKPSVKPVPPSPPPTPLAKSPLPVAKPAPSAALPRPVARPLVPAKRAAPQPQPSQSPQPQPPQSQSPQSQSPQPSAPVASPSPEPVPPPNLPFADMPLLAGTQAGCYGLGTCYQTSDTNFRTAGQTLEQQLQAKGYTVKLRDDLEESGREVYEIVKNGETRYLNVLSADLGNAVYAVTTQPVSLSELQQGETLKANLAEILDSFPGAAASAAQFTQPDAFFAGATARPETAAMHLVSGNSPEQLLGSLQSQLQAQNFRLSEAGGYGGGRLYEVTQAAYTGYLNLVPTVDGNGTIVVLWTNLPS